MASPAYSNLKTAGWNWKESNARSSKGSEVRCCRGDLQHGQHWARLILDASDDSRFGAH